MFLTFDTFLRTSALSKVANFIINKIGFVTFLTCFFEDVKWESMQSVSSSPHHILPSTALKMKLQKSITTDNLQLPE